MEDEDPVTKFVQIQMDLSFAVASLNRAQAFCFSSVMTYKNNYKNNCLLPQLL